MCIRIGGGGTAARRRRRRPVPCCFCGARHLQPSTIVVASTTAIRAPRAIIRRAALTKAIHALTAARALIPAPQGRMPLAVLTTSSTNRTGSALAAALHSTSIRQRRTRRALAAAQRAAERERYVAQSAVGQIRVVGPPNGRRDLARHLLIRDARGHAGGLLCGESRPKRRPSTSSSSARSSSAGISECSRDALIKLPHKSFSISVTKQ